MISLFRAFSRPRQLSKHSSTCECPERCEISESPEPRAVKSSAKLALAAGSRAKPRYPPGATGPWDETTSQQQGLHQLWAFSSLSHQGLSWRWDFHQQKGHLEQVRVKCTELVQPQPSWGDKNTKLTSENRDTEALSWEKGTQNWTPELSEGTQNWAPELSTRICPQCPNPISPRTAILNIPSYKVFNPGPDVVAGISWHCRNFLWISLQVLSSAFSIPGMVLGSEALCCSLSLCSCALPSRFPQIHWFLFIYLTPHYSRDINQNPHHVPNSESKQFLLGHKLSSQAI